MLCDRRTMMSYRILNNECTSVLYSYEPAMATVSVRHVVNQTVDIHTIGSVQRPELSQRPRGYCSTAPVQCPGSE